MKSVRGLTALLAFVICLWTVIVATYSSQAKIGADIVPLPQQSASCTSSGSSSSGEE